LIAGGCPPATSLGITRSFPRLYPVLGLVTVALLTLAPLALRPVRLACLIHAANVHSEPGSNPSKKSRTGRLRRASRTLAPQWPGGQGLRNLTDWSHREDRGPERRITPASEPPRCRTGWSFAVPAADRPNRDDPRPQPPRPPAGFPQGFTQSLQCFCFLLARLAIDRIVKEPPHDATGRCDLPLRASRRPKTSVR
jgi:hypothetical protein